MRGKGGREGKEPEGAGTQRGKERRRNGEGRLSEL